VLSREQHNSGYINLILIGYGFGEIIINNILTVNTSANKLKLPRIISWNGSTGYIYLIEVFLIIYNVESVASIFPMRSI